MRKEAYQKPQVELFKLRDKQSILVTASIHDAEIDDWEDGGEFPSGQ